MNEDAVIFGELNSLYARGTADAAIETEAEAEAEAEVDTEMEYMALLPSESEEEEQEDALVPGAATEHTPFSHAAALAAHSRQKTSTGNIGDDYISLAAFIDEEEEPRAREPAGAGAASKKPKPGPAGPAGPAPQTHPAPQAHPAKATLIERSAPWLRKTRTGALDAQHYGFQSGPRGTWLHFSERLHRELQDFAAFVSPTAGEAAARAQVVRRVDDVVRRLFGGDRRHVECFGSWETQLCLPTSDIDLVVVEDAGGAGAVVGGVQVRARPPLRKLARALVQAGLAQPASVQVISRARVPIVKFTDRATGLPVDVSFDTASGLDGARFLKRQLLRYPALRPLILFLKHFLHQRGLNEVFRGGLGSFSVACLVLSFLQVHPLVQLALIRPEDNLGVLLMELLELYGRHLNYERVGICVGVDRDAAGAAAAARIASPLDTSIGYYDKLDFGFLLDARPHLLSILDPQNPDNDLAKPSFSITAVRMALEHAFNVLSATAVELDHHARSHHPRTDGSILAALVSIPDKVTSHRQYLDTFKARQ